MSTQEAIRRLERAERELEAARRALELEQARALIPTDLPQRTVARFMLRFEKGGKPYSYAAIKLYFGDGNGARWFTTGSTCPTQGYTNRQLAEFIAENELVNDELEFIKPAELPF